MIDQNGDNRRAAYLPRLRGLFEGFVRYRRQADEGPPLCLVGVQSRLPRRGAWVCEARHDAAVPLPWTPKLPSGKGQAEAWATSGEFSALVGRAVAHDTVLVHTAPSVFRQLHILERQDDRHKRRSVHLNRLGGPDRPCSRRRENAISTCWFEGKPGEFTACSVT